MITNTAQEIHRLIAVIEDREWTEFARCQGHVDLFFEPFREQSLIDQAQRSRCVSLPSQCVVCLCHGPA